MPGREYSSEDIERCSTEAEVYGKTRGEDGSHRSVCPALRADKVYAMLWNQGLWYVDGGRRMRSELCVQPEMRWGIE